MRGGLKEGFVKMSPSARGRRRRRKKKADAVKAAIMDGKFAIFKGPMKDNKGKVRSIPAGKVYQADRSKLESMNYLVEGVIGSTS